MDGFASAWAFHHKESKEYEAVEYIPMAYGEDPLITGVSFSDTDLFILDFSFPRSTLSALSALASSVLVLDHHLSAKKDLEEWDDQPQNCSIVFDMAKSGCLLTWNHFYLNTPPALIRYINDRDLWLFKEPYSKDINAVVAITPKEFGAYSILAASLESEIARVSEIGSHLLYQHQSICEEIVKDARPITIHGKDGNEYQGLACNCTPQFASEVGNILAQKSGSYGATYYSNSRGEVKWSLRSIGSYDVSEIAKCYGGGGHRNAAGYVVLLNVSEGVDPSRIVLSQAV